MLWGAENTQVNPKIWTLPSSHLTESTWSPRWWRPRLLLLRFALFLGNVFCLLVCAFVYSFSLDILISRAYCKTKLLSFSSFLYLHNLWSFFLIVKLFFPYVSVLLFHRDFFYLIKIPNRFLKYYYNKSFLKSTLFLSFSR